MAASDDFKEAIRAGRLADALVLAMGNAVELKIATWVVSAADAAVSNPLPGHRLQTRINLIGGEIENEVGDRFIGNGPYTELQKYHHQQVLEGNKTIQKNLQSLSALFQVLIALQQHQANPNEPLSLVDIEIPALPQAPAPTIPTAVQGNDVAMSELDSLAIAATDSQGLDSWENLAVVTPARSESPETPAIPEVPLPEAPVSELEIEDWEGIATTRDSENELGAIADEELFIAETVMPPTATAADSEIPEETMLTWDEDAIDEIATEISAAAPPVLDLPSTTESDDWEVFEEVEISDAVEPVSLEFEVPEDSWDEFEETPPVLDDSGTEVVMADEEEAIAPETSLELPSDLESPEDWSDFEDTFSHPELATAESADLLQPGVETTKAVADDFELSGEEENREAESMAVAMPDLADDWSGFEEETTPETTPELAIEEDWSGFEQESVAPDVPSLALEDEAEDWGDFEEETTPETTPELAIEEDWSGFEQEAATPDVPSLALEDEAEDWGDFEEESTPETTPELAIEEDWSGFEQESVTPDVPSLALEDEAEDWGDFEEETTPELAIEEDWSGFEEESFADNPPDSEVTNLDALDDDFDLSEGEEEELLAATPTTNAIAANDGAWETWLAPDEAEVKPEGNDEDWEDDWLAEVETSPTATTTSESINLGSEDEWADFEALDPFASPDSPATTAAVPDLEENWDDFAPDELEPYPKIEEFETGTEVDSLSQSEAESSEAIASAPPEDNIDEIDWNDETVFGSDFTSDGEDDDDLFSGLTAIQQKPKPPENPDESSE